MMALLLLTSQRHFGIEHVLTLVGFLLLMRLSSLDTTSLEQTLAQAVVDALAAAHITTKEAAAAMRLDVSQLSRQLSATPGYHISLTRLVRLPFEFWLFLGPQLMYLVARKRFNEIAEDLNLRKRA
jgi:hypothetical protein